jgi:uncharacterized protein YbaA (DUF1428 family)
MMRHKQTKEVTMAYLTVMVLAVPKTKLVAYKAMVKKSAAAWKRSGALSYCEAIADDVKPGKLTSFPQSVKLKKGEMVGCAYLIFKSKAHHDKCWNAMMKDKFMVNFNPKSMPFDGKRMFWGGFKQIAGY